MGTLEDLILICGAVIMRLPTACRDRDQQQKNILILCVNVPLVGSSEGYN